MKLWIIEAIAIVAVAGLAAYALHKGQDGAILASAFSVIGGIGGYAIAKRKETK